MTEIINKNEILTSNSSNTTSETDNPESNKLQNEIDKCTDYKNEANTFFKIYQYDKAIELYSKAIDNYPKTETVPAAFYSNRSLAYLRNECPSAAFTDAESGLKSDKNFIKNYYRRASANMLLLKFEEALKDFELVYKRRPKDKDAKAKVLACRKIVSKRKFLKAISGGSGDSDPSETIIGDVTDHFLNLDLNPIKQKVDKDYSGPKLETIEDLDAKFMIDLKEYFKNQKVLPKYYLFQILRACLQHFKEQDSLLEYNVPDKTKLTICGDTHGQFYDLCNIFAINGEPSETNPYLFNGDFVDRGSFSIEVIVTLLGYKVLYPNSFLLTRGNHETINMNELYGFEGETKHKYDEKTFKFFTQIFNWLPLACCIKSSTNKKILVMHGGLFDTPNVTLNDIKNIDRNRQPPESGLMTDILWSDPCDGPGKQPSKRGTSIQFGYDITKNFCKQNNLEYIVRSHEVKTDGFEKQHDGKLYTIFSAPNYCDQMGNKGAFMHVEGDDLVPTFHKFDHVEHPKVRPMQYSNMSSMFNLAGLFGR